MEQNSSKYVGKFNSNKPVENEAENMQIGFKVPGNETNKPKHSPTKAETPDPDFRPALETRKSWPDKIWPEKLAPRVEEPKLIPPMNGSEDVVFDKCTATVDAEENSLTHWYCDCGRKNENHSTPKDDLPDKRIDYEWENCRRTRFEPLNAEGARTSTLENRSYQ
jgi:hypothetical protein